MGNEKPAKERLEELIRQEWTLGTYTFDETKQCFLGDAEVTLYITKVDANQYQSVCYFFDGMKLGR
jgi:hypothetical protein